MKYAIQILQKILEIAKDAKIWLRVIVLAITCFAGAILFSTTKVKKEDCSYYIKQNESLIGALIDIRKSLSSVSHVSYLTFASYDTIVKPKSQNQKKIDSAIRKLDSIILQYRIQQVKQKT